MANKHKIEINKRENLSRQGLKELRKTGKIPGIYYAGGSNNSIPIFITKQDLNLAIKSGARIFNIAVGEKKQNEEPIWTSNIKVNNQNRHIETT